MRVLRFVGAIALTCGCGSGGAGGAAAVASWGEAVALPGSPSNGSVMPNMAYFSDGSLIVAYAIGDPPELGYSIRQIDGTWTGPFLMPGASGGVGLSIAVDSEDGLHFVWVQVASARILYAYSGDRGGTVSGATQINQTARYNQVSAPSVTVDASRRVHIFWHDGDHEEIAKPAQAQYRRLLPAGERQWTMNDPQIALSDGDGKHAAFPRVLLGAASGNRLFVPYRHHTSIADGDIQVAISTDGGASWTRQDAWTGEGSQWDPVGVVLDNGDFLLACHEYPASQSEPVRVLVRRGSVGAVTPQGLQITWETPTQMTTELSRFSWFAYDSARDVVWLVWKEGVPEEQEEIRAAYSTDGGAGWSSIEFVTEYAAGTGSDRFPNIAVSPAGIATVNYALAASGSDSTQMYCRDRSVAAD